MSYVDCKAPVPGDPQSVDAIETIIIPRARDLGGFEVRRVLPSRERQMIGPLSSRHHHHNRPRRRTTIDPALAMISQAP